MPGPLGRRARVALLGATAALVVGTLASCGTEKAELTDRPAPDKAARLAIKGLAALDDGDYTMTLSFGSRSYDEQGSYVLDPPTSQFTRRVGDAGSVDEVDVVGTGDTFYVQGDAVTPAGCWLSGSAGELGRATSQAYDLQAAVLPGPVLVAASARGAAYVDDASEDVNGNLDLRKVLRLVSADTVGSLGVTGGRINAELHLENGVLVGYTVAPHDFATAEGIPLDQQATIGTARLDVTFTNPKASVEIDAPPSDQTVAAGDRRGRDEQSCDPSGS